MLVTPYCDIISGALPVVFLPYVHAEEWTVSLCTEDPMYTKIYFFLFLPQVATFYGF